MSDHHLDTQIKDFLISHSHYTDVITTCLAISPAEVYAHKGDLIHEKAMEMEAALKEYMGNK